MIHADLRALSTICDASSGVMVGSAMASSTWSNSYSSQQHQVGQRIPSDVGIIIVPTIQTWAGTMGVFSIISWKMLENNLDDLMSVANVQSCVRKYCP